MLAYVVLILFFRLHAYQKNADILDSNVIILPPAPLPDWPADGFEQIRDDHHSSMPLISKETIEHYFITRQLKDDQSSSNLKALELGEELLKAKCIRTISINVNDSGIVASAVKKKSSYCFRMKVSRSGELQNSDCECTAGKGPSATCKHIGCVALKLFQFRECGKVTVQKSCTEVLQTFHQPKQAAKGHPPKAEDFQPFLRPKLCDPRTGAGARIGCKSYNYAVRNFVIKL